MKRIAAVFTFVVALGVFIPSMLFAQSAAGRYAPGNVAVGVDGGAYFYGGGIGVSGEPYFEALVYHTSIGDYLPIDIGVQARGHIEADLGVYGGFAAGVGGFGTLHLGFTGISGPVGDILNKLDIEWGLGPVFDFVNTIGYVDYFGTGFGFASFAMVYYYLNDGFAVGIGDDYWRGSFDDFNVGVRLKFGSSGAAMGAMKK
jgi:hypothetical protein